MRLTFASPHSLIFKQLPMKNKFTPFLLLSLLVPFFAQSQTERNIKSLLAIEQQEIPEFDTTGFDLYELAIRFPYGSARILNPADYPAIKSYGKVSVAYIYSEYTRSRPGQKELDRNRFVALKRLAPDLFTDPGIHWEILVQTNATTAEAARRLFHGFVIRYQPPVSEARKAEIKTELDMLVDCAKKRPPANAPKFKGGPDAMKAWFLSHVKFPKDEIKKGITQTALIEFNIDTLRGAPVHVRVSKGISARHNEHIQAVFPAMTGWLPGNPNVEFSLLAQFSLGEDGAPRVELFPLHGYDPKDCGGLKSDSLVMKVMERNKWKKMLVVEDVTGSMMPYLADLLLWNALKSNLQNTRHFVFFNDGDRTPDELKTPGNVGGIYHAEPKNVETVEETMIKAVANGDGGDTPENDIEAVLAGIKACPECEEVVLISDNWATPRDLELVGNIGRPVHVILCGVERGLVNPAHLYIAWKTKGSLHTISEDITKLANMEEGQTISVMGRTYKILNGKFVRLGKM